MANNNLNLNEYLDNPELLSKLKTRAGHDILFLSKKHPTEIKKGEPPFKYVWGSKEHPLGSGWCWANGLRYLDTTIDYDIVLKDTPTIMKTKPTTESLYYPVCTDSYGVPQIWEGQDSLEQAKEILSEAIKDREFNLTDKDDVDTINSNYFILKADEVYSAKASVPELKDCLTFEKE